MFGRKLYESQVHPGFGRNEIDFDQVAKSSRSGLCGNLRRSGPCHQSILSEFSRRSELKESARSLASGSDVGNSRNQTTGRNPGKGPGFTDLGTEKWPNPTQSEMWLTVSSLNDNLLFCQNQQTRLGLDIWHGVVVFQGVCYVSRMNFKSAGERTIGESCSVTVLEELDDARDLLKSILQRTKFVILAECMNLCRPANMGLECWIDLFQWNR
jgi:hypothetical protein